EDGIRDRNVTGVQTCALPIYEGLELHAVDLSEHLETLQRRDGLPHLDAKQIALVDALAMLAGEPFDAPQREPSLRPHVLEMDARSEERRVGKECRAWVSAGSE